MIEKDETFINLKNVFFQNESIKNTKLKAQI